MEPSKPPLLTGDQEKFLKPYDPAATESRLYAEWEASGYFNPDNLPGGADRKPFSVMMPPPNATGVLHMGHALGLTTQDIVTRYKRMRGYAALWLPGTDHAAIATQSVVEKEISKKEGKSRYETLSGSAAPVGRCSARHRRRPAVGRSSDVREHHQRRPAPDGLCRGRDERDGFRALVATLADRMGL